MPGTLAITEVDGLSYTERRTRPKAISIAVHAIVANTESSV